MLWDGMTTMSSNNSNQQMISIGGLWVNKSKDGNTYLAGYFNGARLLIFKNNFKEQEKQPDYVMYIAPNQQRQQASAEEFEQDANGDDAPPSTPENMDDIPF